MGKHVVVSIARQVAVQLHTPIYYYYFQFHLPKCHSSLSPCPSVLNVPSQFMLLRRNLLGDRSGTWAASSAACVTRCWTAPTAMPRTTRCSARHVTEGSLVLKVMDLVEVLEH